MLTLTSGFPSLAEGNANQMAKHEEIIYNFTFSHNPEEVIAIRIHHCNSNIIVINAISLVPQDICPDGQ